MADVRGHAPAGATIRLSTYDGGNLMMVRADRSGAFRFANPAVGWYVLSASLPGSREAVKALSPGRDLPGRNTGVQFDLAPSPGAAGGPTPVLTVCEALDQRDALDNQLAVIVGIFKSGMDETLRLDCPMQLVTGGIGWPSAIGLTKVGNVPDELRGEVEKKRQEILATAPPEAPLRPERVVGLYGRFVSLAGLSNSRCCSSAVQTNLPPARLFGVNETDLRVIR
jgi:hypothetical protein